MSTTIGTVELLATIDTAQYKKGAKEIENANSQIQTSGENATGKKGLAGSFAAATGASVALLGAIVGVGTAAAVAASKFVLWAGINRSLNIEDAQAKLKGLGHDAATVGVIMDNALKSVKGTAFGLDQAASAAASAVAAGVKPGQDLTRVLKLVGDTATISGRSFNEAGAIINKVLASNKLSMEEVNQLQDAGLPILQMLQKEYGVSAEKLRDMVSSGEVDSKRFLNAIEKNIGGAALESGSTTRGAWANMQAAMARVGEAIVKDIIPKVRDAFNSITKWFDDNKDKIVKLSGDISAGVAKSFGKMGEVIGKVADRLPGESEIFILAGAITGALIPAFISLGISIWTALAPLAPFVALGAALGGVGYLVYKNWGKIKEVLKPVVEYFNQSVLPILKIIWYWLGTELKSTVDSLKESWDEIYQSTKPWHDEIKKIGQFVGLVLIGTLIVFGLALMGLVKVIFEILEAGGKLITFFLNIDNYLKQFADSVQSSLERNLQSAYNFMSSIIDGLKGFNKAVSDNVAENVRIFLSLPGRIIGAVSGFNDLLYNTGKNLILGLMRGIGDSVGNLMNSISNLASNVSGAFAKALKINSPSKVFIGFGENIVQGLSKGINNYTGAAALAIEKLGGEVLVSGSSNFSMPELNQQPASTSSPSNITINLSGVMTDSRTGLREVGKNIVRAINEELTAQGKPAIGGIT